MLVNYLRSSSVGTLKFCQQQYYLNYCLGFQNRAGPSATKGTIFHLIFELRALAGIAHREGKKFIDHDVFGRRSVAWAKDWNKNIDEVFKYIEKKDNHIDFTAKKIKQKEIIKWCKNTVEKWPEYDPFTLNIKYAEYHFDITLEDEWAKYEVDLNGQKHKDQLRIVGVIDNIVDLGGNVYQVYDYKGLPIETPIPTKDGWTTMGDVKIGDIVFDRFGKQTKVVGKSQEKFKDCYKITFDDMSTVICDDEHKWKLSDGSTVEIKDLKVNNQIQINAPLECPKIEFNVSFDDIISNSLKNKIGLPQECLRASISQRKLLLSKVIKNLYKSNSEIVIPEYLKQSLNELKISLGNLVSGGKNHRVIVSIEKIEKKRTQCIMVDSPDSTFLCTENMIPTHNSGKMRQDFVTGEEKTLEYLRGDSQLLFYLYACKKIWPDKDFIMSLAFINAGGIYSVIADDSMYEAAEKLIKKSMNEILSMKIPTVWDKNHYDWRCKYCCEYSKPADYTDGKSVCQYFAEKIKEDGIQKTTADNIDLVKLGTYQSGGGKDETNRKDKKECKS